MVGKTKSKIRNKNKNMKIGSFLLLSISILFFSTAVIAQDSTIAARPSAPIPVDMFFGNHRFVAEVMVNKKFSESNNFGFLASTYFAADYKNDLRENESMNVLLLTYDLYKGLGVVGGAALNSKWGFRPFAGGQYVYANKAFMGMISSGFYLVESHNSESRAILQYRHPLKGNWLLYSRLQGLLNIDMDTKKHDRGQLFGRLGVNYKAYGFGFATNLDWYGPKKILKENYGVFVSYAFR